MTRRPSCRCRALTVRPGDRVYLRGQNGCGKSSLLKAVAGLWPYGEGRVAMAEGARLFFAGQEPDLPDRMSLKALVCYPEAPEAHDDLEVARVLSRVGLGAFIDGASRRAVSGQELAQRVLRRPEATPCAGPHPADAAGRPAAGRGDLGA